MVVAALAVGEGDREARADGLADPSSRWTAVTIAEVRRPVSVTRRAVAARRATRRCTTAHAMAAAIPSTASTAATSPRTACDASPSTAADENGSAATIPSAVPSSATAAGQSAAPTVVRTGDSSTTAA